MQRIRSQRKTRAVITRLAVILAFGALCWLAYSAGLEIPWHGLLQAILMASNWPGARIVAIGIVVLAAMILTGLDSNGGAARRLLEAVFGLSIGFTRWLIGDAFGGVGGRPATRLPVTGSARTSLDSPAPAAADTPQGVYDLQLNATPASGWISASWHHADSHSRVTSGAAAARVPIERLNFRYEIVGAKPNWRPLRTFDDGEHTYIQFPEGVLSGDAPLLFVAQRGSTHKLTGYQFRAPYGIVDQLFDAAELRSRGRKDHCVRIRRQNGRNSRRRIR